MGKHGVVELIMKVGNSAKVGKEEVEKSCFEEIRAGEILETQQFEKENNEVEKKQEGKEERKVQKKNVYDFRS